MLSILLAVPCELAAKEAKYTGILSYKLLIQIPRSSGNSAIREELNILIQQSTNRPPYFSAAGFFNVDYTMLLIILGSFTSYLVVIIQFNKI